MKKVIKIIVVLSAISYSTYACFNTYVDAQNNGFRTSVSR